MYLEAYLEGEVLISEREPKVERERERERERETTKTEFTPTLIYHFYSSSSSSSKLTFKMAPATPLPPSHLLLRFQSEQPRRARHQLLRKRVVRQQALCLKERQTGVINGGGGEGRRGGGGGIN